MKKPSRFLRLLGAAALLATLLASVFATPMVYAGEPDPDPADDAAIGDIWDDSIEPGVNEGAGSIFFPWVGNDDESTGLGPADTSTSVMNLSDESAVVFAFVGSHDTAELPDTGGWDLVGPFFLAPWASKTFTAAELGIEEGTGAPVSFTGYNHLFTEGEEEVCVTDIGAPIAPGVDVNGNGECTDVEVLISANPYVCAVDDANGNPAPTVGGDGLNADGDCVDAEAGPEIVGGEEIIFPTVLAGYAKQAVDGENLPYTTSADSSVSGYNSVGGFELGEFDDWYFPIAQTNCGPGGCWNSILRIANFGNEVNGEIGHIGSAAVTARFFPADDAQGSLDTGFQLQALVNTGDVWEIDISDYVPEGWIGSVHVYSDSAIFAMVDRVKVGYGAWITNTASNAPWTNAANVAGSSNGQYVLFAPDVRFDFFGWNTGINVANLSNDDNNINIQYFNAFGNAPQTLTRRLAPQGMTYFYDPSQAPQDGSVQDPTADVNADIIGSALIWSEEPVAVAVDATKYPESTTSDDPNIFQTMSYSATGNVYTTQAFPLVQKGNPTTGMGATSGINIMNPSGTVAQATVWWINPSGFGADNFGQSSVAIPGFANGFVYTMTQGNLPNGFYGSAVVNSTVPVAAVTTQVDYQVEWDGTAVWLGYNPCGFYRDNTSFLGGGQSHFDCNLGDPFNTQGVSFKKTVHDELGDPITGVFVQLVNEAYYQQVILGNESFAGSPWISQGFTDVNGEVQWTNVPLGTYFLVFEDLGGMYEFQDEFGDPFGLPFVEGPYVLESGTDWSVPNTVFRILATKIFLLGEDAAGMEACLILDEDEDGLLDPEEEAEAEYCVQTDALGEGTIEGIEPGWYFAVTNAGFEFPVLGGFNSPASVTGPEFFGLGDVITNDLDGDIAGAEGTIQKVLTLPDFLVDAINAGDATLSGNIQILDPDGDLETEGNVQTQFLDNIGPNDEPSYSMTDFNVPVGGAYTIDEFIEVTWDDDGDPLTAPVVFTIDMAFDETDDQVICDDFLEPSSTCEASPDAPAITVYEDQVTRVFNSLVAVGQLDVFVRDEVTDLPLADSEVCLFNVDNVLIECVLTDGTGMASFTGVADGTYTVNAQLDTYESQGTTIDYSVGDDAAGVPPSGVGLIDTDEASADVVIGLDPAGAMMDILVTFADGTTPIEGVTVAIALSNLGDVPGPGGTCGATPAALDVTDADGQAEFGVAASTDFCVIATIGNDTFVISPASVPPGDPDEEPGDAGFPDFTITFGFDAVLDADVTANALDNQDGLHPVDIHVADGADVVGNLGTCAGALVASGVTTPTGPGTGTFSAGVAAGLYCVAASSSDGAGADPTVVTNVQILAGDPANDSDVAITTS